MNNQIEKVIHEFDYNLWAIAEALADEREDAAKRIDELEEEIKNHECN